MGIKINGKGASTVIGNNVNGDLTIDGDDVYIDGNKVNGVTIVNGKIK